MTSPTPPAGAQATASVALVKVSDIARAYDFGSARPLRPERVLLTYDWIRELGLLDLPHVREVEARVASDEEILAVHDAEFVATVKGIDADELPARAGLEFGLGTPDDPIFKNMHGASAAVCGASVVAAEHVASGTTDYAFNPAGGLHHARVREASGFCIYNDPAVAIARVLDMNPEWRVLYVDVDVHHGDGVQWIFYSEPRVLTVSLHQSGRYLYPGTGFEDETGTGEARGTAVNVPLLPLTGEDDYLWALETVLAAVGPAFGADVLVTQMGADTHWGDPLANLGLTMSAYPKMARILRGCADRFCSERWIATGGGGYQYDSVVPKVWTIHFAEMCGAPEKIPSIWLEDRSPDSVARSYREHVERSVEQVVDSVVPRLEALAASRS
ncbi:MAG TPA: acetoin utilization protein AcuC [Actinomycetota bacterium]|nr:acetoin utilization protein AcuC [Actinomycetota bacterium]